MGKLIAALCVLSGSAAGPVFADWSVTTRGTLFYTDDVGVFSATRRLARDSDPTLPAIDSRLAGQGSDGVFEPAVKLSQSFDSRYGVTTFDLRGDGFIFFEHARYNHGTLSVQGQQAFTPETKLSLRYYYSPDLFLGDNEERRSGSFQIEAERVTSQIGSLRFDQALADGLEIRLLARYGARRYNQPFRQRNSVFWTVGPHLEWQLLPAIRLGLAYHYERGIAEGRNQPEFEDDVSYVNHYVSADLDIDLSEHWSLVSAFHFEHNDWLSRLQGDERNGADENVYQGEILLLYRISKNTRVHAGFQHSNRKESFEAEAVTNTNLGIGLDAEF